MNLARKDGVIVRIVRNLAVATRQRGYKESDALAAMFQGGTSAIIHVEALSATPGERDRETRATSLPPFEVGVTPHSLREFRRTRSRDRHRDAAKA